MSKDRETTAVTERQRDIKAIEVLQSKYSLATLQAVGDLERAIMIAEGIGLLRKAVQPLMPLVIGLMNNPLGFDTDKKKSGEMYPAEVVVDCVVEALLRGLRISGNEFNIIAGKCYTTKYGYDRLVKELPGITDLDTAMSPPFVQGGHTCVKCRASWQLGGKKMALKGPNGEAFMIFAIRVNTGQGIDATLGKAERRMYKAIYGLCTGTQFTEPNMDEESALLPAESAPKTQTEQLTDQVAATMKISPDQIVRLEELKVKVKGADFVACLMRRDKNTIQSLSRVEADAVISELITLTDNGVDEPPV